jgi:asparagine synthase (glutamine-hydrolysing)
VCGIAAALALQGQELPKAVLPKLLDGIAHRGPDEKRVVSSSIAGLAFARLSIVGLVNGSQPFVSGDGRYEMVVNGEVYNHVMLRKLLASENINVASSSDCAVLLPLLLNSPKRLRLVEGMFAFAMYDTKSERLHVGRDPMGEKPLFWTRTADSTAVASEVGALSAVVQTRTLSALAIHDLISFGFILPGITPYLEIHEVPTGIVRTFDRAGGYSDTEYWSWSDAVLMQDVESLSSSGVDRKIRETVQLSLSSDVPIAVALSGGVDSSAVLAVAAQHSDVPLHAITLNYSERSSADESKAALATARTLSVPATASTLSTTSVLNLFPEIIASADFPNADPALPGYWALANASAELGAKVLLFGHGGDELYWGYSWVRAAAAASAGTDYTVSPKDTMLTQEWIERLDVTPSIPARLASRIPVKARTERSHALQSIATSAGPGDWLYRFHPAWRQLQGFPFTPMFWDAMAQQGSIGLTRSFGFPQERGSRSAVGKPPALGALFAISHTYLEANGLRQLDRVAMSLGVEPRVPLASAHLLAHALALQALGANSVLAEKEALRRILDRSGLSVVYKSRKRGFNPPTDTWRKALMGRYGVSVEDGVIRNLGIVSAADLRLLRRRPTSTWSYRILCLEMWLQRQMLLGSLSWESR